MDIHSLKYVSNSYALRMLSLVYFGPLVPSIRFGDWSCQAAAILAWWLDVDVHWCGLETPGCPR